MSSLNIEQKQLLLDHCIGLTSKEQSEEVEALISGNKEAAEIYANLKAVFAPLSCVEIERCPNELVERTMLKITSPATPDKHLTELLTAEQTRRAPIKIGFLSNFSQIVAIAASLLFIVGVLVPTFGYARQKYWQQQCGTQLSSIYQGLHNYIADHDNQQPSVAKAADAQWWKIGNEKESSSSCWYLLVIGGYAQPQSFICPGKKRSNKDLFNSAEFKTYLAQFDTYRDFPNRNYVTYSFPIRCNKTTVDSLRCRKVLVADSNPIFQQLPNDYSQTILIKLNSDQLNANSVNHNHRGQNMLFGDGHVKFNKTRFISTDDIFTLQDTDIYKGNETPSCTTDQFLAP